MDEYISKDVAIKALLQVAAPTPSESHIVEKCIDVINALPGSEPQRLRVEIDREDFDESYKAMAKERGWYRKQLYCRCGLLIKSETWEKEHCFGSGTVLKENKMPNFCPECGAVVKGEKEG